MRVEAHHPERYEPGLRAVYRRWHRRRLVSRIWAEDPTVWSHLPTFEIANRLGWLRLHETMRGRLGELEAVARLGDDADDVVLAGMGGSSLAPEVFAAVLGSQPGRPRLTVLDSTHPDTVASLLDRIDPTRTVFVISSKSGTTLETLSFFRTLWAHAGGRGDRFVAVTDPGTPLAELAIDRGFGALVTAPPDVGGRYSALTPFGLVPAALIGIDPAGLLDRAADLAARARLHPSEATIDLGARWGLFATTGRDKLTFFVSDALRAFPAWLEQLVAESLGKDGTGIVPVAGEPVRGRYGPDRQFVSYRLDGEADPVPAGSVDGHPLVSIVLDDPFELAAEMLRAELATAAAAEILGVHPFDQPDVEAAKELARQAMAGDHDLSGTEAVRPGVDDLAEVFARFLGAGSAGSYVALQAFVAPTPVTDELLGRFRAAVGERTGFATTLGYGPRFLHSTGQLHKGGPDGGLFVQFVDRPAGDVAVPETEFTFGRLIAAQAAGDYRALVAAGRRVLRVDLGRDVAEGLAACVEALS